MYRSDIERELHAQVDRIFDDFEYEVTRSITGMTRSLFERSQDSKEVRLIDLFE